MAMKVFELANEMGVGAIDLVEKLKSLGFNVRNHMVALSDEEVTKAREAFSGASKSPKVTKRKVAKKVVRRTTKAKKAEEPEEKKTTKKVVKKVAAKAEGEIEKKEETSSTPQAKTVEIETKDEDNQTQTKTVTVKRKTKKQKETEEKNKIEAKEAEKEQDKKDFLEVKMHSFTPVYVPEKTESSDSETSHSNSQSSGPDSGDDSRGGDARSKKRMGDLAAMVTKKTAAKTKDVTMMRAEEEMKYASGIVGRAVYTPAKRKKIYNGPSKQTTITEVKDSKRVIGIHGSVSAEELAQKLSTKFEKLANKVLDINLLVNPEDEIGLKLAQEIAALYNYRVEDNSFDEEEVLNKVKGEDKSKYPLRSPVITIMGHVDHGKTSLLDYIRKAKVASGEAGGITQHIGAYQVKVKDSTLTFLDTPGHAAFGAMRQRGANVTDVVVLVVAADDGVMPQTIESIRYCKNAGVPVIVAVNKIDKEQANPDRVKQGLVEHGLTPEDWGGETIFSHISALTGEGVDELLESIQLQAEMMELREDPSGLAEGVTIESRVETGRGPVSTILVQKGTLSKGDYIVVGETFGRARSLMDFSGAMIKSVGPSTPVQVLGLNDVPNPGDILNVAKNEREAKKVVENRINERKALESTEEVKKVSLEDFFSTAAAEGEEKKVLKLVIRADVQGSFEAIKTSVERLGNDEVSVQVIGGGVGAITDNDVILASSSNGYIIGFNMRPVTSARRLAEEKGVDIKNYSIIYEAINDITLALEGMLTPEHTEKYIGRAQVRDTFNIPKVGTIAGTAVVDGKIERGCNIRLLRDGKIIYDGKLSNLKRFKDEVKEVKNGYECGLSLENFNDVKVDDLIEAYVMEEKKRKLDQEASV